MPQETILLKAIFSMTARGVFSVASVLEIIGDGDKQFAAFNLCDGTRTQGDIAKMLKLDPGNFSKTLARWIDAGIVLRLGDGREITPLHVFPLPTRTSKKAGKK